MELFSLLAKLTLDRKEYDKEIAKIQKANIELGEVDVHINPESFDSEVAAIENREINVKDPDLGMTKNGYEATVTAVESDEINENDPDLGMTKNGYEDTVTAVETDTINENDPDLGMTKNGYEGTVAAVESDTIDVNDPDLGLTKTEYSTNIQEAGEEAEEFGQRAGGAFESVKNALDKAGIVAAVAGIAKAFKGAIDYTAQLADTVDKGSKRMGITTHQYQSWDHALQQSGGSIADLNRGLLNFRAISASANDLTDEEIKLLDKLGIDYQHAQTRAELYADAKEKLSQVGNEEELAANMEALNSLAGDNVKLTNDQINAFRMLGVDIHNQNGELKSADELMEESLEKLAEYKDLGKDMNERDNIVDKLFGRNSGGIKPLLDAGVDGMKDLLAEADRLNLVMSDEDIQNAVEYADAMANLKRELDMLKVDFARNILPPLTRAVDKITEIINFFRANGWGDEIFTGATVTAGVIMAKGTKYFANKLLGKDNNTTTEPTTDTSGGDGGSPTVVPTNGNNGNSGNGSNNPKAAPTGGGDGTVMLDTKFGQAMATGHLFSLYDETIARNEARSARVDEIADKYRPNLSSDIAMLRYGDLFMLNDSEIEEEIKKLAEEFGTLTEQEYEEQKAKMKGKTTTEQITESFEDAKDAVNSFVDGINNELKKLGGGGGGGGGTPLYTYELDGRPWMGRYHAAGEWDVPYDNYSASLHRDEMVLSASRAREYRNGSSGEIDYAQLESRLIAAIQKGMSEAQVNAYLNGKQVTDEVSRELANQLQGRRFG